MAEHRRCRGDAAFTLPEVLIVVVMIGLIAGVIGTSYVVAFRSTVAAEDRMADAHAAQVVTAHFLRDAQSSTDIGPELGNGCAEASGDLLRFTGPEGFAATYRIVDGALVRFSCLGGAAVENNLARDVAEVVPTTDGRSWDITVTFQPHLRPEGDPVQRTHTVTVTPRVEASP